VAAGLSLQTRRAVLEHMVSAYERARNLFPFPQLGIDTGLRSWAMIALLRNRPCNNEKGHSLIVHQLTLQAHSPDLERKKTRRLWLAHGQVLFSGTNEVLSRRYPQGCVLFLIPSS
jgi:hypothetical protein